MEFEYRVDRRNGYVLFYGVVGLLDFAQHTPDGRQGTRMALSNALWGFGILVEAAVVCLLVYRGIWKSFPIFSSYCVWDLVSNAFVLPYSIYFAHSYIVIYLIATGIDALFVFGVLVEVSWSILRPIREAIPRRFLSVIGLFFAVVAVAVWPLSNIDSGGPLPHLIQLSFHVQQASSFLRILFLIVLAACSQLLALGWRDRELQVATGMGFYSFVSFGTVLIQMHSTNSLQIRVLNEIIVASYVCSLLYWVYSFAQSETDRREFTPQVQDFLLAIAGVAIEQRLALVRVRITGSQRKD